MDKSWTERIGRRQQQRLAAATGRHYYTWERGEYRNIVVGPNGDFA